MENPDLRTIARRPGPCHNPGDATTSAGARRQAARPPAIPVPCRRSGCPPRRLRHSVAGGQPDAHHRSVNGADPTPAHGRWLAGAANSGRIGPLENSTFSHAVTNALQHQNFDLGSLKLDEIGQGDRSLARLSLVEGDATLSMSSWQLTYLTPAEIGELLQAASSDESTKQLLAMPPILRESLLFPYVQGLAFVQGL